MLGTLLMHSSTGKIDSGNSVFNHDGGQCSRKTQFSCPDEANVFITHGHGGKGGGGGGGGGLIESTHANCRSVCRRKKTPE